MFIAYNNVDGRLELLTVNPDCGLPLEDVAKKDVPKGRLFKFVSPADLPQSDEYREAWTIDFSEPDGVGMGAEDWRKSKGLFIE